MTPRAHALSALLPKLREATGPLPDEMEEWRPVVGFEGLYEVSSEGRMRSLPGGHRRAMILNPRPAPDNKSYKTVTLHRNGERFRRHVHAVVAWAFHGDRPTPKHLVRHLDGDNNHCAARNLAWGTNQDNADDKTRHGRDAVGPKHGMYGRSLKGIENGFAKLNDDAVRRIRELALVPMKQRDIAAIFGVNQKTVWQIIHRELWAHVE